MILVLGNDGSADIILFKIVIIEILDTKIQSDEKKDVKTNKLIEVLITQCPLAKCRVGPSEGGGVGSFEPLPCWYFSHQPATI